MWPQVLIKLVIGIGVIGLACLLAWITVKVSDWFEDRAMNRAITKSQEAVALYAAGGIVSGTSMVPMPVWMQMLGVDPMSRNKSDPSFFRGQGEIPPAHSTVYGLRNWNIDSRNRLVGKVYSTAVWTPGVNVAKCLRHSLSAPVADIFAMPEPDHDMSDCLHGLYAYYDGSRNYHDNGDVTGVIRSCPGARGEVGEKGFRVTKAEIVALMFDEHIAPQKRARVMDLYPAAEVFHTLEEMLTKFPLTAGDLEYVPEADDDFWTKDA